MAGKSARTTLAILKALDHLGESAGASRIADLLSDSGLSLQPRSVRFHLLRMDKEGLTQCIARRKGRRITPLGTQELNHGDVMGKIGFVASKIDALGYRMSLSADAGTGSVVVNTAIIDRKDLSRAVHNMGSVFAAGLGMGDRITAGFWGARLGGVDVPHGKAVLATICSVTINGIFLKAGIPVVSRFGGLLELRGGIPRRFVELTDYQGTSVDPLKIFIMAGMTSVRSCAENGTGMIGASFREFPSVAIKNVQRLQAFLRKINLNGILTVGQPNRPLLDIPVSEGRTGMIVIGGLNPFAALHETGIPIEISPLAGLEDLGSFLRFGEFAYLGKQNAPYVD
jgi:hypothetical protein